MPHYSPLSHPPHVRRVVTRHYGTGHAVLHRDEPLIPVAASTSHPGTRFTIIHRIEGFPVTNQGLDDELAAGNLQRSKHPLGIVCEVVDLAPDEHGSKPLLHRNQSLDYGVVLSGAVVLELDNGVETELRTGDVFEQRCVEKLRGTVLN